MSNFEQLKDKLAYFGGYKWLPYVDAEELLNKIERIEGENERLKKALIEIKEGSFKGDYYYGWTYDISSRALKEGK